MKMLLVAVILVIIFIVLGVLYYFAQKRVDDYLSDINKRI